ncbi:MAG: ABATE domain-containing protein, partial [Streptomyces sp.]|nr:ABATE domain-containing protein [Streptomyces sp.]
MSDRTPLTGEPLALDLVNTRTAADDLLATPDDLLAWWALEADRLPEVPEGITATDLAAVLAVRDAAARALDGVRGGARPREADLRALNAAQRAAPAVRELEWDGSAVAGTWRRAGSPGEWLAAQLAESAAELLTDPAVTKVRQCEADDCVLLFLPA